MQHQIKHLQSLDLHKGLKILQLEEKMKKMEKKVEEWEEKEEGEEESEKEDDEARSKTKPK